MNVLFLSSVYPHRTAPVRGTYNAEFCQALSTEADVRVIAPFPWTELKKRLMSRKGTSASGSSTCSVPVTHPLYLYPPGIARASYGSWMWHSVRRHVDRQMQSFRPDWVLSYWAHPDGEAGLRVARKIGAKAGVIIGGSDVLLLTSRPDRRRAIVKVLCESDAVFTVCEGLRDRAIELGAEPGRVHTVYQGVRSDRFQHGDRQAARRELGIPSDADALLFVGRLVGVKRLDVMLDAFSQAHARNASLHLYLAGSGPDRAEVLEDVRRRNLSKAVTLVGPVEQSELPKWYQAASATVLSSDSEGLPNVLRESLACGTPFVSTNVGSICEISGSEHSVLVPAGDSQRLSEGMLQILEPVYRVGAQACRVGTWRDCARDYLRVMSGQHRCVTRPLSGQLVPVIAQVQSQEC